MSWLRRGRARSDAAQEAPPGTAQDDARDDARDGAAGDGGGGAQGAAQDPTRQPGAEDAAAPGRRAAQRRGGGPFDLSEVTDALPRVDLGALRVPALAGMELRLELEETTRRVVAATVGLAGSTAQLQAFAAPRTEGIWDQVREEITASVVKQGGAAEEVRGPFGTEVLARMPARTADGRTGHRPSRFIGVDGPRWFLRAVLSGPAAVDPAAARPLELLVSGCVVVRGTGAMAPRDLLVLTLPPGQAAAAAAAAAQRPPQVRQGPAGPVPPADAPDGRRSEPGAPA
ncbi:DUF3710 domain-containing protein [Quadrisphaera sp. DSM 44207]|uniref:DUF3710 domain-containing protein n=1 Tax=Quadrisphaera sp. DSM 44207 TaxID=1881057 RepID=UPI0008821C70|nr:DUF3710 domain-containing protein [Quadrisphaera sp. DSM 44207]SDQ50154.1 Protein of unknown function [Quadrisphaera sp. DSM 44207]